MQQPQILGVMIGSCLIVAGWFLRRCLVRREMRVTGGIILVILAYIGALFVLQNAIFSYAPTWSWSGVWLVWADWLGMALVPIVLAFLGLIYRPNKVAGYFVVLVLFTGLMMLGV